MAGNQTVNQRQFRLVEIPSDGTCIRLNGKPCFLAYWVKHMNAYNCKLYGKLLKGDDRPVKCTDCLCTPPDLIAGIDFGKEESISTVVHSQEVAEHV